MTRIGRAAPFFSTPKPPENHAVRHLILGLPLMLAACVGVVTDGTTTTVISPLGVTTTEPPAADADAASRPDGATL